MPNDQPTEVKAERDDRLRVYLLGAFILTPVMLGWGLPLCLPVEQPLELPVAQSKVEPNRAPWQELAVLPMIGEGKARAIVAYRDVWDRGPQSPRPPFTSPQDLTKISGIGPKTVAKLAPHLRFEQQ